MSSASRQAAFLRGVNVGRAKRVAMSDLRVLIESLGFQQVVTVLNSGNAVYSSPELDASMAGERIEGALAASLGLSARVFAVEAAELRAILATNPFAQQAKESPSRLLVALLAAEVDRAALERLTARNWGEEAVSVSSDAAYLWCPVGQAASSLVAAFGAATRSGQTTRNWSTMTRVASLL